MRASDKVKRHERAEVLDQVKRLFWSFTSLLISFIVLSIIFFFIGAA